MGLFRLFLLVVFFALSCKRASESGGKTGQHLNGNYGFEYWQSQRKGANYFNKAPTKEWFLSAASANIKLVRFTYEKWIGEERDFLLGSADNYTGIVEQDFERLVKYLNIADSLGIKIVLTTLSLPGARYAQNNNGVRDGRLWKDLKYHRQAAKFWKDLATRLIDHPAIVGLDLINEPHPEWFYGKREFWDAGFDQWYSGVKGTAGDLNLFNRTMVSAIREVDKNIPIVVESGLYGTPWAFEYLEPLDDENVIYSFHMYEPYDFTTARINKGRYGYPGRMLLSNNQVEFELSKLFLKEFLSPINDWCERNKVPAEKIWVGEFGCDRSTDGVAEYLKDLIEIFNENNWHWSFYSYREDVWAAMDYELGTSKPHWKYWEYEQAGTLHLHYEELYDQKTNDNEPWDVLSTQFMAP